MFTSRNKIHKISLSIFVGLFLFVPLVTHADTPPAEWGNKNTYSAGQIQRVPEGYGLTAIGYGSDDWQCIIGIKTAAINADGTIDDSSVDSDWRITTCTSGAPRSDWTGNEKFFQPTPGTVVTGWSWGADTSGGSGSIPGTGSDSFPEKECYYQQYTNLLTGATSNFGDANTGTCADRGYAQSDLKAIATAPAGRVIVGIKFNIGNDAVLDFLAMSDREALSLTGTTNPPPPPPTCPAGQSTVNGLCQNIDGVITVAPGNSGLTGGPTLTCTAPCSPDVHWKMNVGASAYVEKNSVLFSTAPVGDVFDQSNLPAGTYTYVLWIRDDLGTAMQASSATVTVVPPTPPPPIQTTCSLSVSTTSITSAPGLNSVTWTVTSNPSGLPYFWNVTQDGIVIRNNVPGGAGGGTGITPDSETFTYTTPATYRVYFTIPADSTHTACSTQSSLVTLNVTSPTTPPPPPPPPPQNQPPVLTLLGQNPTTVTKGSIYVDAGAKANDPEEGDISNRIVVSGSVDPTTIGSYAITYNVSDSQGLAAIPVTRLVYVINPSQQKTTTCDLTQSASTVTVGGTVSWTVNSNIAGAPYFWTVVTTIPGQSKTNTPGDGNGLTTIPATSFTYTYSTVGTYSQVYFSIPADATHTACQSNILNLTVTSPIITPPPPTNQPPVITLLGQNPVTVIQGNTYTDAGATAQDPENGNITSRIVVTGLNSVDVNTVGSYTITYNVTDLQGLAATPVTRTVNVVPSGPGGGNPTGSITFCLMLADPNNVIATSSVGFPGGVFSLDLMTATSSGTIQSPNWSTAAFAPNKKTILSGANDSQCITYNNLALSTYYYSQLGVTGTQWATPLYNDQNTQAVNNVFDFFLYSPELFNATTTDDAARNLNSDGQVTLVSGNANQTIVVLLKDNPGLSCPAPQITSILADTATVGQAYSYTITASSTPAATFSVTGTLPDGLTFSTTTNTISGTPTQNGVFNITLNATNPCANGLDTKVLVLTISPSIVVTPPPPPPPPSGGCGGNCGGGGGGGGGGPVYPNALTIFNESVLETVPGIAMVTWNTNLPATRRVLYDTVSHPNVLNTGDPASNYGYNKSTELVDTPLLTAHSMVVPIEQGKTYYFREISTDVSAGFTRVAIGKEVMITGGAQPVTPPGSSPAGCRLLYDYMRKDLNNNPTEVTKLQTFLRDIEGYTNLSITGVYDDATVAAVNAFQVRYGNDILVPWGYSANAPTGYEYILTQKKVNEIYCNLAFPLTPLQQNEIDSYRNFLQSLRNAGITSPQLPPSEGTSTPLIQNSIIGIASTTPASQNIFSKMLANVLYALGGAQCPSVFCGWFNLLLILVIIVLSYYLYKERQYNKKLDKANKEIDLSK